MASCCVVKIIGNIFLNIFSINNIKTPPLDMLIETNLLVLRYLKVRNSAGVQRHNIKFNFKSNERTVFKGTYSYH